VTGVDGRVRHTVDIKLDAQTMMHDFSLTEKYVVIYDLPVELNLTGPSSRPAKAVARWLTQFAAHHAAPDFMIRSAMRASERGGPPQFGGYPYRWAPERPARIGLLPRTGTAADIRWFEVQPCYVFHPLNAFDEAGPDGEKVVLDVVRHESVFADEVDIADSRTLDRWTVALAAGTVHEERLDDRPQEFPRVDERLVGRRHRYGYAVGYASATHGITAPNAILRHDMMTGICSRMPLAASWPTPCATRRAARPCSLRRWRTGWFASCANPHRCPSPRARSRCSAWWPRARPTPRSGEHCTSARPR
jgi:carotenoid cleavage dioxygenase